MEYLNVGPYNKVCGIVNLPGSKSISNRVLLLASLSKNNTLISNLLDSDDTRVMFNALIKLGVKIKYKNKICFVTGSNCVFPVKDTNLFLGNSGTSVRFLTSFLSINKGNYRIFGTKRMHERPISDLVNCLTSIGAKILYKECKNYLPIHIFSSKIIINSTVNIYGNISSQFLTSLLIVLPIIKTKRKSIIVNVFGDLISKPYIDITIKLMRQFGVKVKHFNWNVFVIVNKGFYVSPGKIFIEGDASSLSYFITAGILGGGPLFIKGVGKKSIQGDIKFAFLLKKMGANLKIGDNWIELNGILCNKRRLKSIVIDANLIPDAAMTLAVIGLFSSGKMIIKNIASWRVKETDRIFAMVTELRKFGGKVNYGCDFIEVEAPNEIRSNVVINTYNDHRIAMCFSLISLLNVFIRINNPNCVTKTFPLFFNYLFLLSK